MAETNLMPRSDLYILHHNCGGWGQILLDFGRQPHSFIYFLLIKADMHPNYVVCFFDCLF